MIIGLELEDSLKIIQDNIKAIEDDESLKLEDLNGRVLDEDIYATIYNPPFDRSPLDGYAVIAEDTTTACRENPITLKVIDEVFAGGYSKKILSRGEAIRIMTGAKMPEGSNAVIRQENTDEGMETVKIYEELKKYDNYIFKGEDIEKGTLLMKKGEVLSYVHIGILASMGIEKVKVKRLPKIALFVTGDEVLENTKELSEGKIYDSNLHLIYARLLELGIKPYIHKVIGDDYKLVGDNIKDTIDEVDMVITTGGVSVGKKDILHEALPYIKAETLFWKVNLQPGTPAIFSILNDKPILSLSGNPFAALATFELLARTALYKLTLNKNLLLKRVKGTMESEFNKRSKKRRFIRAIYNEGKVTLNSSKHSSGMLSSMIGCNALIDIPKGRESLKINDEVNVILI